MRFSVALVAAALAGGQLACQGNQPEVGITEINGVAVVENRGGGAWAHRPDSLRLVLEQIYGVEADPEEAVLGNGLVLRIVGTQDGDIYVQDGQRGRLIRFHNDGTVAWTAGHAGQGPGEFFAVTGVNLTPDGRSLVVSNFAGRLDFWSTDGEFLRSLSFDPERGLPGVLTGFVGERMVFAGRSYGRIGAQVSVFDPRNLHLFSVFEIDAAPGFAVDRNTRTIPVKPYSGYITGSSSASFEVRFYTAKGDLVRRVTRDVPCPVRPGYFQSESGSGRRHSFGRLGTPIALPGGFYFVPVSWEQGVTDPDATAAERGLTPSWDPDKWRVSFDIFDAEGRFMQSIVPPGTLHVQGRLTHAEEIGRLWGSVGTGPGGSPYLYTISLDPFPQVRRFRIEFEPFE